MHPNISLAIEKIGIMTNSFFKLLPNLTIAFIVVVLFWLLAGLVKVAVMNLALRSKQSKEVGIVLGRLARWAVIILGILIGMTIIFPSLNASSLFGALGIGGVAIGFAFKDIFQNLLAGLLILMTRPFHIGDQIISQDHEGTVEDIQIRATTLRTYDNRLVVIPNSELYTNRVTVNTFFDHRRISVTIGIGYNDDIEKAKQVIITQLLQLEGVLNQPKPQVLVQEMGDSSVNLGIYFWISPPSRKTEVELSDRVFTTLKPALFAAGISIPFPIRQLVWDQESVPLEIKKSP